MEKAVFCFLSIDDETVKRQLTLFVFRYYGSRIILFQTIKSPWITVFAEMIQMLFIYQVVIDDHKGKKQKNNICSYGC